MKIPDFLMSSLSGFFPPDLFKTWIILLVIVAVTCFVVSEITRNYSQVDKIWSLIPIVYAWIAVAYEPTARLILMASLVTIWGLRLSYNFYRKGGYSIVPWRGEEDYRWKVLREHPTLKGRFKFGFFNLIFISFYQNILILLFSSPLLIAAAFSDKGLTTIDMFAGLFMLGFIITESLSDNQLFRFHSEKRRGGNGAGLYRESIANGFMTEGLWKYSRHPNFASEQAIWISFYLFGVASSGAWLNISLAGPVLLVLLFLGSSQLTENISSSKYPGYVIYKKSVPRYIPRFFR